MRDNRMNRVEFAQCVSHVLQNRDEFSRTTSTKAAKILSQFIGRNVAMGTVRDIYKAAMIEFPNRPMSEVYRSTSRTLAVAMVQLYTLLGENPPEDILNIARGNPVDGTESR